MVLPLKKMIIYGFTTENMDNSWFYLWKHGQSMVLPLKKMIIYGFTFENTDNPWFYLWKKW